MLQKIGDVMTNVVTSLTGGFEHYTHSFFYKFMTYAGGGVAVIKFSWAPDWFNGALSYTLSLPWVSIIANTCLVLLFIERSFICWAWYRKWKRREF